MFLKKPKCMRALIDRTHGSTILRRKSLFKSSPNCQQARLLFFHKESSKNTKYGRYHWCIHSKKPLPINVNIDDLFFIQIKIPNKVFIEQIVRWKKILHIKQNHRYYSYQKYEQSHGEKFFQFEGTVEKNSETSDNIKKPYWIHEIKNQCALGTRWIA